MFGAERVVCSGLVKLSNPVGLQIKYLCVILNPEKPKNWIK